MSVEVRALAAGELDGFIRADSRRWGNALSEADVERSRSFLEEARVVTAVDGGSHVGGAAILPLTLGVPGGRLPAAGVTWVAVDPLHRRRGVLRAMMRNQLEELRDGGEPVAVLYASESSIYARFGYGVASHEAALEIERSEARLVAPAPPPGRLEIVDLEEFLRLAPEVFRRITEETGEANGMLSRTRGYWPAELSDDPDHRDGFGPRMHVLHHGDGGVDGYVLYRLRHHWDRGVAAFELRVVELLAGSGAVELALWQHVLTHDLVGEVHAGGRPVEEPLVLRLADPRRLRRRVSDALHLRIVDPVRALEARRYACPGGLVLEVVDPVCPWVAGRYALEGSPEGASCRPADRAADLRLDAGALGAAYLGGVRLELLCRAGRVTELRPGAVSRATTMLSWPRPPWNAGIF